MKENFFQNKVIRRLKQLFPEAIILKSDAGYLQGFPDIIILFNNTWAVLEVKASKDSHITPNQSYYVDRCRDFSYSSFIYPENMEQVFNELQQTFRSSRSTRIS